MSGDKTIKIKDNLKQPYLLEIPSDEEIKKVGRPYVKLVVFDTATSHKVLSLFIKKRWSVIRFFLKNQNTRTRSSKHPDLIKAIFDLNKLSVNHLKEIAKVENPQRRYYKTSLIAQILMLKGKNPEESVKKYLTRYKNKIKDM